MKICPRSFTNLEAISLLKVMAVEFLFSIKGGGKAIIKQQLMSLSVAIWNGTRPCDIDEELLDSLMEKAESETNTQALSARLIKVYYHLDKGYIDETHVILDSLGEDLENEGNTLLVGTAFAEKAFICAAYRMGYETAITFLEIGKKGYVEDQTIARAESSLLMATGETEKGISRAKQGLEVADDSIDKGGVIFEKEILKQLAKGYLPDLVHS